MTPADPQKYEYNIITCMALHRTYLVVLARTGLHTTLSSLHRRSTPNNII